MCAYSQYSGILSCLTFFISLTSMSTGEITTENSSACTVNTTLESSCRHILDNLLKLSNSPLLNATKEKQQLCTLPNFLVQSIGSEIKENTKACLLPDKSVLKSLTARVLTRLYAMREQFNEGYKRIANNWEDIEKLLKTSYLIIVRLEHNHWNPNSDAFFNEVKTFCDECAILLQRVPDSKIMHTSGVSYISMYNILILTTDKFLVNIYPGNIDLSLKKATALLNRICHGNQDDFTKYLQELRSFYGMLNKELRAELFNFMNENVLEYCTAVDNYSVPDCDKTEMSRIGGYLCNSVNLLDDIIQILSSMQGGKTFNSNKISAMAIFKRLIGDYCRQLKADKDNLLKLKFFTQAMAEMPPPGILTETHRR